MADADVALATLRELVELESPSGDVPRLNALRDVLRQRFEAVGARVTVHEGPAGDHLEARIGDGDRHVLLLAHYDTVWPVGRPGPFTVDGEVATGPGVFDMKGSLVALLWALDHLSENPPLPLRILVTSDEEVGSPSGGPLVQAACNGAAAVFALEPPLVHGTLKVGRRGVARVRLAVTGREAHAGLDAASGVSAIDELVDQLAAVRAALPSTPSLSVNTGRITGGTRANVVAGAAEAELGLRFATADDERTVFDALDALAPHRDGAALDLERLSYRPAWEPSQSLDLAAHVQRLAASLGEDVDTAVSGGAGDANLTGALGVPTVDGLGPRGQGAHAPNEAVELPSILQRAKLLQALFTTPLP
jgi:glutamate carboxypeptidase